MSPVVFINKSFKNKSALFLRLPVVIISIGPWTL